ncbi:MAG: hypothetical protein ACE1Y7_09335 [Lysobacteraceae bacterium]
MLDVEFQLLAGGQAVGVALASSLNCVTGIGELLFGLGALLGKELDLAGEFLQAEVHLLQINQSFEIGPHGLVR